MVCAALKSPQELRAALDAGADDVMRIPFEPEVLAARVGAGLRAARLRANEALLRSLVANIPGALYRCACDEHWTMLWLSDEIEQVAGYPANDFIGSAVRTVARIIHPDDREQVERSVGDGVAAGRPFTIEYRIIRRDGGLPLGAGARAARAAEDGRRWLDGAIFDVTARRAAEQALHQREIAEAQLAEVQASRARIVEAADRARREIDATPRRRAAAAGLRALRLQVWLAADRDFPPMTPAPRSPTCSVTCERAWRSFAIWPAAFTPRCSATTDWKRRCVHWPGARSCRRAADPLPGERLPASVESAAYFIACEALANVAKHAHATLAWVPPRSATATSTSRSATTAPVASISAPARACKDSRTASPHSTAR